MSLHANPAPSYAHAVQSPPDCYRGCASCCGVGGSEHMAAPVHTPWVQHRFADGSPACLAQQRQHGGAQHSALISGARDTIVELKRRGFRIGLATNDSAGGLEASLAQHDVLHLFESAVGCDSGFGSKPDPRMVRGFCKAVGADVGEVAMVGDAVHDLTMGRAAGVALNVGVLSGTSAREDLEDLADLILPSINDLPARPEFAGT